MLNCLGMMLNCHWVTLKSSIDWVYVIVVVVDVLQLVHVLLKFSWRRVYVVVVVVIYVDTSQLVRVAFKSSRCRVHAAREERTGPVSARRRIHCTTKRKHARRILTLCQVCTLIIFDNHDYVCNKFNFCSFFVTNHIIKNTSTSDILDTIGDDQNELTAYLIVMIFANICAVPGGLMNLCAK